MQIYWNESDDMTVEEHNSLKKDGIPELWTLIGKLSEDEEAIKTLKALWDSRYQKHVAYYSKDIL